MTDEQMASLRAAAEKATPGPWEVETDLVGDYVQIAAFDATGNRALCIRAQSFRVADDATYIALANPAAVLELLDRVAAAEARVDAAWRAGRDAAISVVRASGYVDKSIMTVALSMLQPPADMAAAAATCDAVAVEREACAKLAASQWGNAGRNSRDREGWHNVGWNDAANHIAAAIRARGGSASA